MRGLALLRSLNHIGKLGEFVAGQLQRKYIEERSHQFADRVIEIDMEQMRQKGSPRFFAAN